MGETTLTRSGWNSLFDEDLEWLQQQPRSLERDHIAECLRWMRDHRDAVEPSPDAPARQCDYKEHLDRLARAVYPHKEERFTYSVDFMVTEIQQMRRKAAAWDKLIALARKICPVGAGLLPLRRDDGNVRWYVKKGVNNPSTLAQSDGDDPLAAIEAVEVAPGAAV